MKLTNIEKETILNFNEGEEVASLYTYNQKLQKRFDALATAFPLLVSRKTNSCGAVTYELSKKMIVLKIQKPLSAAEQRTGQSPRYPHAGTVLAPLVRIFTHCIGREYHPAI